jgi:ATP-dependent DNA helicase RecG
MTTPIEKLTKILQLERETYQDRAVVGGLASYADTWQSQAQTTFGPEASEWVQEITQRLQTYSKLPDATARREAMSALLQVLKAKPAGQQEPKRSPAQAKQTSTKARSPRKEGPSHRQDDLNASVTALKGIGPKRAEQLARLGVHTVRDMLYLLPRRYDDYSHLKSINRLNYGEEVTILARVQKAYVRKSRGGGKMFKAVLTDGTGSIEVTWFNQPWLSRKIKRGQQIAISGKVDEYLGRLCFSSPQWEPLQEERLHTGRIVPVYPLTEGLTANWLRKMMKSTVGAWAPVLSDYLPDSVREQERLLDLETAIVQAHFPDSQEQLKRARYRLAFDELFLLQIGLLQQRHEWRSEPGKSLPVDEDVLQAFIQGLPYELTAAQQRTLRQIVDDLRSDCPMTRLLQGDVGSGKTVVATAAMALTAASGAQAALMAPTEILAEQHYRTISDLLDYPTRLLTGSVTGQEREEIYAGLADGNIKVIVGTHALIQEDVRFKNLALAVVDEQHRFGVRQRAALRQKGQQNGDVAYNPNLLVMTATPIPRSLQLTVWGHLDVSVIDEMPPGRQPITTRMILPTERERAYAFVRSQIEKGRQAFFICPLVEESDKIEAKAAVEEHEKLQRFVFPDLELGLLHGRMTGKEKEATMARFAQGELDILVATSVIEVGIDVPNATVMLIEGADRFGLAQLHQFRGRVGRGEHASYCLLVSDSSSSEAQERLQAVESTNDGFKLAQKDLEMRGPGEFLGVRQSGYPDAFLSMDLARITDLQLVETAREAARRFFKTDPELTRPAHQPLARRLEHVLREGEIN